MVSCRVVLGTISTAVQYEEQPVATSWKPVFHAESETYYYQCYAGKRKGEMVWRRGDGCGGSA
jgi:hypothetical protein